MEELRMSSQQQEEENPEFGETRSHPDDLRPGHQHLPILSREEEEDLTQQEQQQQQQQEHSLELQILDVLFGMEQQQFEAQQLRQQQQEPEEELETLNQLFQMDQQLLQQQQQLQRLQQQQDEHVQRYIEMATMRLPIVAATAQADNRDYSTLSLNDNRNIGGYCRCSSSWYHLNLTSNIHDDRNWISVGLDFVARQQQSQSQQPQTNYYHKYKQVSLRLPERPTYTAQSMSSYEEASLQYMSWRKHIESWGRLLSIIFTASSSSSSTVDSNVGGGCPFLETLVVRSNLHQGALEGISILLDTIPSLEALEWRNLDNDYMAHIHNNRNRNRRRGDGEEEEENQNDNDDDDDDDDNADYCHLLRDAVCFHSSLQRHSCLESLFWELVVPRKVNQRLLESIACKAQLKYLTLYGISCHARELAPHPPEVLGDLLWQSSSSSSCALQELRLYHCSFPTLQHVQALAHGLLQNQALRTLKLEECGVLACDSYHDDDNINSATGDEDGGDHNTDDEDGDDDEGGDGNESSDGQEIEYEQGDESDRHTDGEGRDYADQETQYEQGDDENEFEEENRNGKAVVEARLETTQGDNPLRTDDYSDSKAEIKPQIKNEYRDVKKEGLGGGKQSAEEVESESDLCQHQEEDDYCNDSVIAHDRPVHDDDCGVRNNTPGREEDECGAWGSLARAILWHPTLQHVLVSKCTVNAKFCQGLAAASNKDCRRQTKNENETETNFFWFPNLQTFDMADCIIKCDCHTPVQSLDVATAPRGQGHSICRAADATNDSRVYGSDAISALVSVLTQTAPTNYFSTKPTFPYKRYGSAAFQNGGTNSSENQSSTVSTSLSPPMLVGLPRFVSCHLEGCPCRPSSNAALLTETVTVPTDCSNKRNHQQKQTLTTETAAVSSLPVLLDASSSPPSGSAVAQVSSQRIPPFTPCPSNDLSLPRHHSHHPLRKILVTNEHLFSLVDINLCDVPSNDWLDCLKNCPPATQEVMKIRNIQRDKHKQLNGVAVTPQKRGKDASLLLKRYISSSSSLPWPSSPELLKGVPSLLLGNLTSQTIPETVFRVATQAPSVRVLQFWNNNNDGISSRRSDSHNTTAHPADHLRRGGNADEANHTHTDEATGVSGAHIPTSPPPLPSFHTLVEAVKALEKNTTIEVLDLGKIDLHYKRDGWIQLLTAVRKTFGLVTLPTLAPFANTAAMQKRNMIPHQINHPHHRQFYQYHHHNHHRHNDNHRHVSYPSQGPMIIMKPMDPMVGDILHVIACFLRLNMAGRKYLVLDNNSNNDFGNAAAVNNNNSSKQQEAAMQVLASCSDDLDCLFLHLLENPAICGIRRRQEHHQQAQQEQRKRMRESSQSSESIGTEESKGDDGSNGHEGNVAAVKDSKYRNKRPRVNL